MSHLYHTDLHQFVEAYFSAIGATITDKHADYFIVIFSDGRKERYTYLPRIAGENKEIKLLAKGSKEFRAMVQECSTRAAVSQVKASYSSDSIKFVLHRKSCCDLCPFITICEREDGCCDFCPNYKSCNTRIENADFVGLGEIVESQPADVLCFIFQVELSNDYSLSQKIQKTIAILIHLETGEVINNILARDLPLLDMEPWDGIPCLNFESYSTYLNTARQGAEEMLKEHLDVFKKEIEGPLHDKIVAITTKFEEDYAENYVKNTFEQLEELQNDAVKLCEREIRGYTINCSYHIKNVVLLHTADDTRNIIFKLQNSGRELTVAGDFFLSRIDIKCSECGSEIDVGMLCNDGHVLCKNCTESCSTCHEVICDLCDQESVLCSTCGETTCSSCIQKCAACGADVCPSHAYTCVSCGSVFCIDCYEVCTVCGTGVCKDHVHHCSQCNEPVCAEHIHHCSTCGQPFCEDHTDPCGICGSLLCEEHSSLSAYSGKVLCQEHTAHCAVCNDIFGTDEICTCTKCGDILCPSHHKECSKCHQVYCSKHINHCRGCGSEICDCTPFRNCSLCGEEFCPDCINAKGHCSACERLVQTDRNEPMISRVMDQLPGLEKYKHFYLGTSKELRVLYGKGLINGILVVCSSNGDIISSKELGFFDNLKAKSNTTGKGR